jgi:hypothetical protein
MHQLPCTQHSRISFFFEIFALKMEERTSLENFAPFFTQIHIVAHHIPFSYRLSNLISCAAGKEFELGHPFFSNYATTHIPPFYSVLQAAVSVRLRSSHKPISIL